MSLDLLQELQMRRWARINYVSKDNRDPAWNAVILTEMELKDQELDEQNRNDGSNFVPLEPTLNIRIDSGESTLHAPRFSKIVSPYEILVHR